MAKLTIGTAYAGAEFSGPANAQELTGITFEADASVASGTPGPTSYATGNILAGRNVSAFANIVLAAKRQKQIDVIGNGASKHLQTYYDTAAHAAGDYGSIVPTSGDTWKTMELDWVVAQYCLNTFKNVYIPAGRTLYIDQPLLVRSNYQIVGDGGAGTAGAVSSVIKAVGDIAAVATAIDSTTDPVEAAFVSIRGVEIVNSTTVSVTGNTWVASTAYALGAQVLPDMSVSPTSGSGRPIRDAQGFVLFYQVTTAGSSGASEPVWPTVAGLTVTESGGAEWTCFRLSRFGIDMAFMRNSRVENVLIRSQHAAIRLTDTRLVKTESGFVSVTVSSYYNLLSTSELTDSWFGVLHDHSGNSNRVLSNRIHGNTCGAFFGAANANVYVSDFEDNIYHTIFGYGSVRNSLLGCRFEGNSTYTRAAIVLKKGDTSNRSALGNMEFGCSFEDLTDAIDAEHVFTETAYQETGLQLGAVDPNLSARNTFLSPGPALYRAPSPSSSGQNLLTNPGMEISGDQLVADGWTRPSSQPAQVTYSVVADNAPTGGSLCQRIDLAANAPAQDLLWRQQSVVGGCAYTLSFWFKISQARGGTPPTNGAVQIFVGKTQSAYDIWHGPPIPDPDNGPVLLNALETWRYGSVSFVVPIGLSSIWIALHCRGVSGAIPPQAFLIDSMKLEFGAGMPTAYYEQTLPTETVTMGLPLPTKATITPTHPIHPLQGAGTISTIGVPPGFSGTLRLLTDSKVSSALGGNIANVIHAVANTPIEATFNPVNKEMVSGMHRSQDVPFHGPGYPNHGPVSPASQQLCSRHHGRRI